MSKLSILGMYNYDSTVFADFDVPEGLQKQDVVDAILLECAELELLYSSFNMMKIAIRSWTQRELPTWEKLQSTVSVEYNPLWNVDATIQESGTNTRERSGSGSDDGTDTHAVKGYNSSSWSDSDKVTRASDQEWTDEESGADTRNIRRTGNIGVTSTQQLIQQEREVAQFNTTDYIVKSFKRRFCLMVY